MSTYNLNIDTVNTSLTYFQAEKYIYGSSRLGMLKDSVNVLGSAYGNTDTSNYIHTLGNKRYELSNHLGNVLAVISDKPIPHNNGGTVDYWQADIKSAYDYSPFGVMLTGRTFEGKQTICHDSTTSTTQKPLEEGFSSWGSWTTMGNGLVTYVSGEMQVSNPNSSKKDIGASKAFTTGTGVHNVSFKVIGNTCATVVIWPPSSTPIPISVSVKDNYGNVVASGNYTTAGTYNLSFTPASAGANYTLEFHMTKASAFCFFRVDDVLVSYDDTTTVTVCKEVEDGYRYAFQSQERDDEVSGKGNSYTAEFWQYSPRLGRRWNVDPMFGEAPDWSPYRVFFDNPIIFIDPNGLFETKKDAKMYKKEHNIKGGVIRKNSEGRFNLIDKKNDILYSRDKDGLEGSNERYANDGVMESYFIIIGSKPSSDVDLEGVMIAGGSEALNKSSKMLKGSSVRFYRMKGTVFSPKIYPNAWGGGSVGKIKTYKTSKLSRGLKIGGGILTAFSVIQSEIDFSNGDITKGRRDYNRLNTVVGIVYPFAGIPIAGGDYLGQKYHSQIEYQVTEGILNQLLRSTLDCFGLQTTPYPRGSSEEKEFLDKTYK